jgi:DNA-binding Lrp family transcriptional regulator
MRQLDRQIVHCLLRDGRAAFRRIAEVLDVSEQTVARRYRALCADGAMRVRVVPNERALGMQRWFVRIQCRPDSAGAVAEALAARGDVSWVSVTSGGAEVICVALHDPGHAGGSMLHLLPRTGQILGFTAFAVLHEHVGKAAKWPVFDGSLATDQVAALTRPVAPAAVPRAGSVIRIDDAALLAALADDGRATVSALARATGLPASRVAARVGELLRGGAARVTVDLAPARFGLHATAYLWLTVIPGELAATATTVSLLPETTFTASITGTSNLLATVTCRDLEALYVLINARIGALPAVRRLEVVPVLHRLKQAGTRVRDGRLVLY